MSRYLTWFWCKLQVNVSLRSQSSLNFNGQKCKWNWHFLPMDIPHTLVVKNDVSNLINGLGSQAPPHGPRSHKCRFCPYVAHYPSQMRVHERSHTGERPFHCPQCPYSATSRGNLTMHLRTHTGEKPYKCRYCAYSAVVSSALVVHERRHTRGMSFEV